ncbi:MAG: hypothetical protein WC570_02505 [Patescibacteria group bacterium]
MSKVILIPAILAGDKKQLIDKIEAVEDLVEYIQIDYMDGKFVPHKSNFTARDYHQLNPVCASELHMMINHPENHIHEWISAGIEKFIVHIEALVDWEKLFKIHQNNYLKLYLAINPETPLSKINNKVSHVDGITVMGVNPGKSHQKFQPSVLGKIKTLRNRYPQINIQVDGGLHTQPKNTIQQVILAGANEIVVGSDIFLSLDIEQKIDELEAFINKYNK